MLAGSGTLFEVAGIAFGLREGVIALLALVALYIIIVLWRMRRLRRAASPAPAPAPVPAASAQEQAKAEEEASEQEISDAYVPPRMPAASPFVPDSGLQQEMALLREELDAVRGELAALRDDMHQELAHLRAAQTVSPIYGDAMQMAVSGYDAAAIAERCGIARAEAELVVALANSRE